MFNFQNPNLFKRYFGNRFERFYLKNRWHLIFDLSLITVIILLLASVIVFSWYRPEIGQLFRPNATSTELDLNNPPLDLDFSLDEKKLELADGMALKIKLSNLSDISLKNVKINLLTVERNFSVLKLENQEATSGVLVSGTAIKINALAAQENQELNVKVYFKNQTGSSRTVKWQAQVEYFIGSQVVKETVTLPDLNLTAELLGTAKLYYHSPQGDQLGSGPLPPIVGLPTNYWVFFEAEATGDFNDLVFSAKLPKGVEITDRRSLLGGDFKYNSSSRQVVWTVSELKPALDGYRLGFEIQFIPTETQLAQKPVLISEIRYHAKDALTGEEQQGTVSTLTTNLDFDKISSGQGEVNLP